MIEGTDIVGGLEWMNELTNQLINQWANETNMIDKLMHVGLSDGEKCQQFLPL